MYVQFWEEIISPPLKIFLERKGTIEKGNHSLRNLMRDSMFQVPLSIPLDYIRTARSDLQREFGAILVRYNANRLPDDYQAQVNYDPVRSADSQFLLQGCGSYVDQFAYYALTHPLISDDPYYGVIEGEPVYGYSFLVTNKEYVHWARREPVELTFDR